MLKTTIAQLMQSSQVKFGTSGARGLVNDMSDQVCYAYTMGFIQYLEKTQQLVQEPEQSVAKIALAGDLRSSTPRILNACARAILDSGYQVINAGLIPTPAVALYGLRHHCPAIMVTGSHIPDDRNGIKFYKLAGEILKEDELIITTQQITLLNEYFDKQGQFSDHNNYLPDVDPTALNDYKSRYLGLFPENAFAGKKIGVYQHSGVARDIIPELLEKLGAKVMNLAYADHFIPVDTEAVRDEDIKLAKEWAFEYQLDAIVSTDGDADRPLISDETGEWLRGDIVGFLCAEYLQIDHIVTPVSSNSCVEQSGFFVDVKRTKIGSPYVIEAMNHYLEEHYAAVAGYEANGGFLLATPIRKNNFLLTALPTRDAIVVLLTLLHSSVENKLSLSQLSARLPQRYTYSDRIKNFPTKKSQQLIEKYTSGNDAENKALFEADFPLLGRINTMNTVDGLRLTFENENIIHFRPSGNAPELRCYSESDSIERAKKINHTALQSLVSL
ncbi:MAG: phosphomannomutase [gamma proteobacterium symbiont of Bathyaustriella thionipta]|nr:phosphomannomutase [gamma proteobacterium symbiont of Bathyaustriella thionipta]MCU7949212.1 phosphomannomutase [gamma proteobacterium symbiont of Bathyaustriella thionipta]MCU7954904.1 phosphomannomutase [gamma proteobacterium symbiont of Bathyaustriella thionipta]MCU7955779.1 phosphomannomutase [gamma proteobacterium symbiont of Bathyaustriella thionipta]MCU7966014.1 phosphomannomutase [gamma proteobacterium symbiont of Bathyaustriella thionipta]